MAEAKSGQIVNVMKEERLFPPPKEFSAKARIGSISNTRKCGRRRPTTSEGFWGKMAPELHWFKPYTKVLEWNEPFAKWFVGGQTNVSYNCLDAHLNTPRRNKAAIIWEGEPGDVRVLYLRDAAPRGLQVRQRAEEARHPPGRRGGHATCRWCPSWPSPCWPAPGSARSTRSFSAASRPRPSPTATTTPRPS